MGTQQLFLLALASLLIGLALVVGLDQFASGAQTGNKDQMRLEASRVAKHAQAWYRGAAAAGGGGRSFSSFSFERINYNTDKAAGVLTLSNVQHNSIRLTATLHDEPAWSLVLEVSADTVSSTETN